MKRLGLAAMAMGLALVAPAGAVPYHFVVTGGYSADFVLDSRPVPSFSLDGVGFEIDNVTGTFKGTSGVANLTFYNSSLFGGLQVTDARTLTDLLLTESPQLYTGSESSPTFLLGTAVLTPSFSGTVARLTVTPLVAAVPEPGLWAMLIAGLGLTGAMLRRRRGVLQTA